MMHVAQAAGGAEVESDGEVEPIDVCLLMCVVFATTSTFAFMLCINIFLSIALSFTFLWWSTRHTNSCLALIRTQLHWAQVTADHGDGELERSEVCRVMCIVFATTRHWCRNKDRH
jgi:hypothetical protein